MCWILTASILATVSNTLALKRNNILQAIISFSVSRLCAFSGWPLDSCVLGAFDALLRSDSFRWCWACNNTAYASRSTFITFFVSAWATDHFATSNTNRHERKTSLKTKKNGFFRSSNFWWQSKGYRIAFWLSKIMKMPSNVKNVTFLPLSNGFYASQPFPLPWYAVVLVRFRIWDLLS